MDFDRIILTPGDKWILFCLHFVKKKKITQRTLDSANRLLEYGLVDQGTTEERNKHGFKIPDGTVVCSKLLRLYRAYRRKAISERIVTPIFVSVVSSFITAVITVLLMQ